MAGTPGLIAAAAAGDFFAEANALVAAASFDESTLGVRFPTAGDTTLVVLPFDSESVWMGAG